MTNKNQTLEKVQRTIELNVKLFTEIMVDKQDEKERSLWFDKAMTLTDLLHDLGFIDSKEWISRLRNMIELKHNINK